jgi:hypothetical protein
MITQINTLAVDLTPFFVFIALMTFFVVLIQRYKPLTVIRETAAVSLRAPPCI